MVCSEVGFKAKVKWVLAILAVGITTAFPSVPVAVKYHGGQRVKQQYVPQEGAMGFERGQCDEHPTVTLPRDLRPARPIKIVDSLPHSVPPAQELTASDPPQVLYLTSLTDRQAPCQTPTALPNAL